MTDIAIDSRAVNAGGIFVCIEGFTVDGHNYVGKAVDNGARVIVASKPVDVDLDKVAVVMVENTARAISLLASRFYDYPSKRMTMIGVTGTNGKTSVSGIIQAILHVRVRNLPLPEQSASIWMELFMELRTRRLMY